MIDRVVFPFRGAELGGSHIAAFTLGEALQAQGGVVCVIVCPANTLIEREAQRLGFQTVASGEAPTGSNSVVTDMLWASRRRDVLNRASNDARDVVVHCSDINTLRSWGLAAKLAALKVVYHHHALNRLVWPPHLVSLAYADAVVGVSDATVRKVRGWRSDAVKELNPFLLDLSIDRGKARSDLLEEYGWSPDSRVVGWVGNFWKRKRPLFFLEVAAELYRRDGRYRFVMFGRDGDHSRKELTGLAQQLGLAGTVALPGFRQPAELNIACLDLLLAPAPQEPFGRTLVEAILLGTPVAATSGAGHSEILAAWGGGELLDPAATPLQMAGVCERILQDSGRVTLPAPARRAIAEQLEPQQHAARMMDIYANATRRDSKPANATAQTEGGYR
ncbi:MAG: glycosyltransferase [Alphaproteobacteria bacterium]|nr:MAG: glycosyltransferase [Alphaproteobacteria bacterium]